MRVALSRLLLPLAGAIALATFALVPFAGCGDDAETPAGDAGEASTSDGKPGQFDCPRTEPASGEACGLPDTTHCVYGGDPCHPLTWVCQTSGWSKLPDQSTDAGCPSTLPAVGTKCARCTPLGARCVYVDAGCQPDGAIGASATCNGDTWDIVSSTCPVPEAGPDTGPDTGADASTDARPETGTDAGSDGASDAGAG